MRPPNSILETVLHARDLEAARGFYEDVLGLRLVSSMEGLSLVFRVNTGQVLLIFDAGASGLAGRVVPSHGSEGAGHVAFRISSSEEAGWITRFGAFGVAVEQIHDWDSRGRSVYVRDPAGNSAELITDDIWPRVDPTGGLDVMTGGGVGAG